MGWYPNYLSIVLLSCSLIVLSNWYFAFILAAGKTRNMPADLHLLVQVFCCRVPVEQAKDSKPIPESATLLCSVHNMIFFAADVLSNCKVCKVFTNIIKVLDNSIHRIWFSDGFLFLNANVFCAWRVLLLGKFWATKISLSHHWVYLLVKPPVSWQYTCYRCSIYINPSTYPLYNDVTLKSRYM